MRAERASTTAMAVALLRGLADREPRFGFADPTAARLLPGPWAAGLRALRRAPVPVLRWASAGLFDHVGLRTRAIDEALQRALARGAEQLVLLGAGFDGRADRLPSLAGTRVFEVDHPATQAAKRRALGEGGRVFVSVDFQRERLAERLAAEGHAGDRPTAWIWEGVTPYLERPAVEATLRDVAQRSARSSTLLMTYSTGERVDRYRGLLGPVELGFRVILGEALHGWMSPEEAAGLARAGGFEIAGDEGSSDWSARWLGLSRPPVVGITERLLEAVRS